MKKTRYVVFNYTDNIFASPDVYDTKKEAKEFIKQFRKRYDKQGYYKTNTWEKINPEHIDLEILDEGFSPFEKGGEIDVRKKPSGIKFDDSPIMKKLWNERGYDIPYLESLSRAELKGVYETEFDDEREYDYTTNEYVIPNDYAKGGRILVGRFDEKQLKNKEDKKAIEKAQKESGLTYIDSKIIKKGGKMFMEVHLIPNEEYYSSSKFAKGGRVSPTESATQFEVGTIKTGNDGNDWIIKADKNGRQSWRKYTESIETEDGVKITEYVEEESSNWSNFFENNPDKVLGKATKVKTKFGKEAIVIKKTDDSSIDLIEVPTYNVNLPSDFSQTEVPEEVTPNTMTDTDDIAANRQYDNDDKTIAMVEEAEAKGEDLDTSLYTFDEVDKEYNGVRKDKKGNVIAEAISDMAKCAYIYYIEKLHERKIKGGFAKYSNLYSEQQLLNKGELFYDYSEKDPNRRYQPKFLFESGNIADKKTAFENNQDRYEKSFGKANARLAKSVLEEAYKIIHARRLTLDDPDVEMRLKISLRSKEAKTFKIKGIINPYEGKYIKGFSVYAQNFAEGGMKSYKSDLYRAASGKNTHYFEEMSISDAFFYWLQQAGWKAEEAGIRYNNGVTMQQILEIYYLNAPLSQKHKSGADKKEEKQKWIELKGRVRNNGDRLFSTFLATGIDTSDRRRLEHEWNRRLNSHLDYDVNKVPIGFRFTRFFGNAIRNDIRSEKRDAIAYYMLRGSCLFAYGVGIGKTWCSIFTMAQVMDMGLVKRPLIVVPKQVYAQFTKEIATILGTELYPINALYNCTENIDIITRKTWHAKASVITDNSISICTYHGMQQYGFSEQFDAHLLQKISEVLSEGNENVTERQRALQLKKHEELLGKGTEGATIDIDSSSVNFDFLCFDEAHNAKKVFRDIKGDIKSDQTIKSGKKKGEEHDTPSRARSGYESRAGGKPSTIGIKLFFLTQYIQSKTTQGNTLLMTATPFTNSPLEVYSMLALINHNYLKKSGFDSVKSFYDVFADMEVKRVMTTGLRVEKRPVFVGWKNLVALQDVVHSLIDKKGRAEEDKLVERPTKIVLPYKSVMKNGINYPVAKQNRISTTLKMFDKQIELKTRLLDYANLVDDPITNMPMTKAQLCGEHMNTTKFGKMWQAIQKKEKDTDNTQNEEDIQNKEEKVGVRSLETLTYFRHLTINPYLYSCSGYTTDPTPSEFVEASPKMLYVVECIKSIHNYEKRNKLPMSGQVIYMGDIGVEHGFPLLAEYLVKELELQPHEVGMITGAEKTTRVGKTKLKKDAVQDAFLGRKFNEETTEFETIPDARRCKILIGSSSIREGMNLQFHASTLYNLYLDFNPTDITQLEGRIWRQGNRFDNVRIVTPLLEDSMDIFMFQKLEEKTARINQIWNRDGTTNELNTEDFDPNELKEILTTSVEDLAKLQAEDATANLDDEIEALNREYVRYRNFLKEYTALESFYTFDVQRLHDIDKKIPAMYHFLRAFRPDLVPLDLVKASMKDKWSDLRYDTIKDEHLNYTLQDLIDKMVQMHKDKKIAYPENYTSDWQDLIEDEDYQFKEGDKVEFETNRGKKRKGVVVEVFNNWSEASIQVGSDKDNIMEEIRFDNMKLIKDKPKEKKKEKLTPFTWGTKEWKEKIFDINAFQMSPLANPNAGVNMDKGRNWREKYSKWSDVTENFDKAPKDYGYNTRIMDYFGDMDAKQLLKMDKWIDFQEYMKDGGGSKRHGYNMNSSNWSGSSEPFWNLEYPLIFKKIEKAEKGVLANEGIKNKEQLDEKIAALNTEMSNLATKKAEVSDEGNLALRILEIEERIEKEKKEGIRTAATYKNRAKEFGEANADYAGNNYLDILAVKYLLDTVSSVEEFRETAKYQELTKGEIKKFEKKLKAKLKQKTEEVIEVKEKPNKAIQILETRIKTMSMIAAVKKGKDKKKAQDRIKTLKMTLSFKKGK